MALGREKHETSTGGVEVDVKAGDVVVVPAGVSHRSLSAYGDYWYIGVYPEVGPVSIKSIQFSSSPKNHHANGTAIL